MKGSSEMENCLFCKILKGDIPSDKVFENEYTYAFRDINPQAPEHILVIPKKHFSSLSDIDQADDHAGKQAVIGLGIRLGQAGNQHPFDHHRRIDKLGERDDAGADGNRNGNDDQTGKQRFSA